MVIYIVIKQSKYGSGNITYLTPLGFFCCRCPAKNVNLYFFLVVVVLASNSNPPKQNMYDEIYRKKLKGIALFAVILIYYFQSFSKASTLLTKFKCNVVHLTCLKKTFFFFILFSCLFDIKCQLKLQLVGRHLFIAKPVSVVFSEMHVVIKR